MHYTQRYRTLACRRPPLWNIRPTALEHLPTFRGLFPRWNSTRHARRCRAVLRLLPRVRAHWNSLIAEGYRRYGGDHYRWISGGFQSHWPEPLKDQLRSLAHAESCLRRAAGMHLQAAGRFRGRAALYTALRG